ncbi:MAG: PQQ-binding-like beta-propeller repeat protein [Halioglobus sp.]|nr:PQQ-binding-like beta-propeller repeat protein [Halioglobus sp.]
MTKYTVHHATNWSRSLIAAVSLAVLALAPAASGQDEPLMDGMGNLNTDVLNADSPAAALYRERCAECHDNPVGRVPPRASLRYRPAEGVYQALLAGGTMSPMAEGLTDDEIKSLVKLLTGREPAKIKDPIADRCASTPPPVVVRDGDWTSTHGDLQGHRFRKVPTLNAGSVNRLQLQWAYAYPGSAAGPVTVAGNTLFLAGTGYVVALSADSGCVRWAYPTNGRIVRAVTVAAVSGVDTQEGALPASVVLFGDDSGTVSALDASSGDKLWQSNVESHMQARITAAPTVYNGVVYVPISSMEDPLTHDSNYFCCSARGGVAAVALHTGELLWKQQHITAPLALLKPAPQEGTATDGAAPDFGHGGPQFRQGPAGASTYTPLTIDTWRGLVYASTAEEYGFTHLPGPYSVIAYDLKNGERAWQRSLLPDTAQRKRICSERETDCRNFFSMGTSVLVHPLSADKDVLVVGTKSGMVHALDPDHDGRVLWSTRVSDGGDLGGVMYALAADAEKIYVPISDVDSPTGRYTGSLLALDPASGAIVWRTPPPEPACNWDSSRRCIAGQVAALTVVSDTVFASFWDGYVRVYATGDGRQLTEIDTARQYQAVNGSASGGQVSGYPVTVVDDALYITSGASSIVKPGNALLVYTLDGE